MPFKNSPIYTFFVIYCFFTFQLLAQNTEIEEPAVLRIQELIPENWNEFPSIDPFIPENFILKVSPKDLAAIWGTKEDLEAFFEDPLQIKSEVIKLNHSINTIQTGPDTFLGEDTFAENIQELGFIIKKVEKLRWGDYPVLAVESVLPDNTPHFHAWVGLNSPNGTTIDIRHYAPKNYGNECPIWKNFLHKTSQLKEQDLFRSIGMDMRDGFTIYKHCTASLKVTAERRISDDKLAIMIEPITPNTTYETIQLSGCLMGSQWRHGDPCIKIKGLMTEKEGKYGTCEILGTITVIIKEVKDFSFDLDLAQHPENVLIHQLQYIRRPINI